jgi:hypothetical protein
VLRSLGGRKCFHDLVVCCPFPGNYHAPAGMFFEKNPWRSAAVLQVRRFCLGRHLLYTYTHVQQAPGSTVMCRCSRTVDPTRSH